MEDVKSIEDQVLDRLMEKLRKDEQISPGLVTSLEELRRRGDLARPERLVDAYRKEVTTDGTN